MYCIGKKLTNHTTNFSENIAGKGYRECPKPWEYERMDESEGKTIERFFVSRHWILQNLGTLDVSFVSSIF